MCAYSIEYHYVTVTIYESDSKSTQVLFYNVILSNVLTLVPFPDETLVIPGPWLM